MKVLVLSHYWTPQNNVPQRRWQWLSGILLNSGFEVDVICPFMSSGKRFSAQLRDFLTLPIERGEVGESIFRIPHLQSNTSLVSRALNQAMVSTISIVKVVHQYLILRRQSPDVVIGTVPALPTALQVLVIAGILKRPYVIDLRDAWPELLSESHQWNKALGPRPCHEKIIFERVFPVISFLVDRAVWMSLRNASRIIVTTQAHANYLKSAECRKNWRHRDVPIDVVRNVFSPSIAPPGNSSSVCGEPGLNVLYAGTVGRAQNINSALEAVRLVTERGGKINFRIVGGGAAWQAVQDAAKTFGLDVEFIPQVAGEELLDHYQWADTALVHLTDWKSLRYSVPSKTYELMSLGIHITAVADGETKSLVSVTGSGHSVSPECPSELAELWLDLLDNPASLAVSPAGAEWVSHERKMIVPSVFLNAVERAVKSDRHATEVSDD